MAHKTMVDGTAYDIPGGKTMVDGTVYSIQKGKTMVDGTVREIAFGPSIVHVYLTGSGNSTRCRATIRGERYYLSADDNGDQFQFEMESGEEIEAYATSSTSSWNGNIIRAPDIVLASGRPAQYTYKIPSGIAELRIDFKYSASNQTSVVTFYES